MNNISNPINKNCTSETKNLYNNLMYLPDERMLWGVQLSEKGDGKKDAWDYCYEVSGKYPGLLGLGFCPADEKPLNNDYIKKRAIEAYNSGGISTICWHNKNYTTGSKSWVEKDGNWTDEVNTVHDILPGGAKNSKFVSEMDELALLLDSLYGADGKKVPVIFRPWHEMNGSWFWWGETRCSNEEFRELYRYTIDYLIRDKGIINILTAWSPNGTYDEIYNDIELIKKDFMRFYPGDDYVDIIGLDMYTRKPPDGIAENTAVLNNLYATVKLAHEHNKIPAMCEGFYSANTPIEGWWVNKYLNPFKNDPILRKIKYTQVWRSDENRQNKDGILLKHAPYPGVESSESFREMAHDPYVIMMGEYKWYDAK